MPLETRNLKFRVFLLLSPPYPEQFSQDCYLCKKVQIMAYILLFFSGGEIIVIVFFILLFFGADAIPGVARTIGKMMSEFHKATDDIKREISDHTSDLKNEITNLKDKVEQKGSDFTRKIDDELK